MEPCVPGPAAAFSNTPRRALETVPVPWIPCIYDDPPLIDRRSTRGRMRSPVATRLRSAGGVESPDDSGSDGDLAGSSANPIELDDEDDDDDNDGDDGGPGGAGPDHSAFREEDPQEKCYNAILTLFPGLCPEFLRQTCFEHTYDYNTAAGAILDKIEGGESIPRRVEPVRSTSKRKRQHSNGTMDKPGAKKSRQAGEGESYTNGIESDDDDDDDDEEEEDVQKAQAAQAAEVVRVEAEALQMCLSENKRWRHRTPTSTQRLSIMLFQQKFRLITKKSAAQVLLQNDRCLLRALLAFDTDLARDPSETARLHCKHKETKLDPTMAPDKIDGMADTTDGVLRIVLEEYRAALRVLGLREAQRAAEEAYAQAEQANFAQAERDGSVQDCQCCFDTLAMNRMVHCDGGAAVHWFCKVCARRMAETQLGLSKHALVCMSMDGCAAGFSRDQKRQFLSRKTRAALDRLEMEDSVRRAGLDSLETCPFCPFAAEYPPVEEDREFRCLRTACAAVSCRLCRKPTHVPKTCAESVQDTAATARLAIEEAMSEAMIRRCNQCSMPFIKEIGCNKMRCSRPDCLNVQCYVCHKSCDYSHFDDTNRGGATGNCPLFESVEKRHGNEVRAAEENARRAAQEENPDIDPASLQIVVSEAVLADEERRMQLELRNAGR